MAESPPVVTPYLLYEDVAAALEWLSRVFGFREQLRYADPDGTVTHAEMTVGGGSFMLGDPGPDYRNPNRVGGVTQLVHIYVDDVDAHFARARDAGATILAEPRDQEYGDRRYEAADLEGHHWSFAQRVREVAASEWGAVEA